MTDTLTTARGLKAAAVLALLAAAALPLGAAAQQAADLPDQPIGVAAEAMTVVRDAETGKVRAPTADELAAFHARVAARRIRTTAAVPITKYHSSGAIGVSVTEEMSTNMVVAVRNAKGTTEMLCIEPGHSAEAAHTAASHQPQLAEE